MITVTIRRQGGAAVMTIPSDVLKLLDGKRSFDVVWHSAWV
jgi:antitoxin component of MazEF toxin-antitoxin module